MNIVRNLFVAAVASSAVAAYAGLPTTVSGTNTASGTLAHHQINSTTFSWDNGTSTLALATKNPTLATNGTPGVISTLTWCNGPSACATPSASLKADVLLNVKFNPTSGAPVTAPFAFAGNYNAKTEVWTFDISGVAAQTFVRGNTAYKVALTGIGAPTQKKLTWTVNDGCSATINIYGSITTSPVPEPATLAAMGIGGLALLRRKKK